MTFLHLITGFLGSGKTSLINSLLEHLVSKRIGLILNDFGPIAIDDSRISKSSTVLESKSLNGGQIFCSCLSGSFVDSVEAMLLHEPDMILVEASGLAKPASLLEIVTLLEKRVGRQLVYGGMVCVIDVPRYGMLAKAVNAVEEQVVFSDACVLNKIDLAGTHTLATVQDAILSLRPLAPIFITDHGEVTAEMLFLWDHPSARNVSCPVDIEAYAGWGAEGRPKTLVFSIRGRLEKRPLELFLATIAPQMFRIKGFLQQEGGKGYSVDVVGPMVSISDCVIPEDMPDGVVCIHRASLDASTIIQNAWSNKGDPATELIIHQ